MFKKLAIVLIIAPLWLSGCATNAVTGKSEFRFPGAGAQAVAQGKAQYAPMRQSQGGDYNLDRELTAYVDAIGQRLAQASREQNGVNYQYEFKVINNSVPNAWALPGGKIALNRGLLTEMNSEAELAAVIGHEIVHAAAEHSASQVSKGMLLQGAMIATQIGTAGSNYAQLAQIGASVGGQLVLAKFGRNAELESDQYGMNYMSRAGYDPQGAVELQKTFVRLSEGRNSDWLSGLFASHPPSQERVNRNIQTAASLPAGGKMGVVEFQNKMANLKRLKPAYDAYDEGRRALAQGDLNGASSYASRAINMEPRESQFHALRGDIEIQKKNYPAARSHFDQAIQLNQNFFYNHLQRGLINNETGNITQAKQDLQNSVQLLPSMPAYYYLGNIAKQERDYNTAKKYYSQVAQSAGNSEIGQAAYGSLVELDLQDNPHNYIQVRTGISNGQLMAEITNTTPRDVAGLQLLMQYTDANGQVQQGNRSLQGVLGASSKQVISLGIQNPTEQMVRSFKAQVVRAQLAGNTLR